MMELSAGLRWVHSHRKPGAVCPVGVEDYSLITVPKNMTGKTPDQRNTPDKGRARNFSSDKLSNKI
jgi:hypothetical protein